MWHAMSVAYRSPRGLHSRSREGLALDDDPVGRTRIRTSG
jgi:hypothetical protein